MMHEFGRRRRVILGFLLLLLLLLLVKGYLPRPATRHRTGRNMRVLPVNSGFPLAKPDWVRDVVLDLHQRMGLSHRKLANTFNRLYFVETGVSVGRTWVRELIKQHEYERLDLQRRLKHHIPSPLARNVIWGIDTAVVTDLDGVQQIVLGAVDHGSRLNVLLQPLKRFNRWTFLGYLFLAIGQYGKPKAIKTDNAAVFHAKLVKRVLRWAGVRMLYSQPGKPWQNGRIERFFGTLKAALVGYPISDWSHLMEAMVSFRTWYNVARVHQHLAGRTPQEAWDGVDPMHTPVKRVCVLHAWGGRLRGMVLRR
jgi:transposase InsO family protein